ncbi:MAG TPA: signal peptidase II [Planktothrix sp.]|jgi:signal peptidase II
MALAKERTITPTVALLCFLADFASKQWARRALAQGVATPFINGVIQFMLTANTGAAFSVGYGHAALMTGVAVAMTAALILWTVWRERKNAQLPLLDRIGAGCILGGAIGNLCDRFMRGRVTDFIQFSFVQFPTFNVADSLIDIGIALLLLQTLRSSDSKKGECRSNSASGTEPGQ